MWEIYRIDSYIIIDPKPRKSIKMGSLTAIWSAIVSREESELELEEEEEEEEEDGGEWIA